MVAVTKPAEQVLSYPISNSGSKNVEPELVIPAWTKPKLTEEVTEWANLETIDLSLLDSTDAAVRADLVRSATKALTVDGFMFCTGLGVSQDLIERHLAIAQKVTTGTSREDKEPYAAKLSEGSYRGYKLRGIWTKTGDASAPTPDNIEHFNLESESFSAPIETLPPCIRPHLPEVRSFAHHTYHYIIRRILTLISIVLGLEEDALWKLHDHGEPIGAACQRYMAYTPRGDEDEAKTKGIWSKGHTDYNTVSLLFSQPITALQILTPENEWKWVKHVEGGVVVNVADALDFLSGGVLKATRHRVIRPPSDQANIVRYILIHFARAKLDLPLNPITESPLVRAQGRNVFQDRIDAGGRAPTQGEWLSERIRRTGAELYDDGKKDAKTGLVTEEVLGRKVEYYV